VQRRCHFLHLDDLDAEQVSTTTVAHLQFRCNAAKQAAACHVLLLLHTFASLPVTQASSHSSFSRLQAMVCRHHLQLEALVEAVLELKAARARLRGNPDVARPLAGRAAVLLAPQPCLPTRIAFETVGTSRPPCLRLRQDAVRSGMP
jgi:hypothetical protein